MSQFSVPCSVYRGGTSRGIFFLKKDLPEDVNQRNDIFMQGIDSYNLSQVNGLGSGTSHTSKVVVINPSSVDGAEIDYTFYQIGIGEEAVDDSGTCGNLMAAAGAFAVDEGLVETKPGEKQVTVSVYNTNINKMLSIQVPVSQGFAQFTGDYFMPGIVTPGAKFIVDIMQPGGGKTGYTLPLGASSLIQTESFSDEISVVDVINPFVYVSSESVGVDGTEPTAALSSNKALLEQLERIRLQGAIASNLASSREEAAAIKAIPKLAIVSEPQDYTTSDGRIIKKEDIDIRAKMLSMERFHRTFAASGLYNLAAAVLLKGTIPNRCSAGKVGTKPNVVRIGHPEGIVEVRADLTDNGDDVAYVGLERTARRIMKGDLYIPY